MKRYFWFAAVAAALLSPAHLAAQAEPPPIYKPVDTPITIGFTRDFRSRKLDDVRKINVYLPEHIGEPGRRFPVLILLDGGVKEDFLHIAGLAQITAAYGEGQEIILIGVEGVDRRHDLTSPSSVPNDRKLAPTSGGADAYRRFLVDELKPWIDATFQNHGRTAVMGESLAGLFVLETLLREPSAFDDYISVSPSLWWDGGRLARDAAGALRRAPLTGRRLWLGFERPAPPADQARRERALQDAFANGLRTAAPNGLWWRTARLDEGHASVYHPAALQAFRALYSVAAERRP
ncbi:MAG: hypothetical protein JWO25_2823 [Alphaproteobacteria bacterium]|nr:hypothetical protein [Alphaproteobacteria bacterium]